jgi:hypothetical protein
MGWSVIPLNKNKEPLIKWGEFSKRIATEEEIERWLEQFPDAQVGIVTGEISNLVVIDVEAGGDNSLFPSTYTVRTGGGGYHFYYQYPGKVVRNATRILELTDIRGDGGYVVAPPSVSSKGPYSWYGEPIATEAQLKRMPVYPQKLMEKLAEAKNDHIEAISNLIPVGMRNDAAAKKIGEILSRTAPERWEQTAWSETLAWNLTALTEPLLDEELRKVFSSIAKARRQELEQRDSDEFFLKPFTLRDLYNENFPPIEWVAKDLIPLGCLGAITGESNSYKSFMTLALAQAVATGVPYLGHFATTAGKVLVIDEENNRRIIEQRFRNMGIEPHDNIVFLSQTGLQIDREAHRGKLLRFVEELQPRLIVMDSLVRLHGRDENSATEMRLVMKALSSLVSPERSVIIIHHHKKEQGFASKSGSGRVRGSSDIFAALDFHLAIERRTEYLMVRMLKLRVQPELPPFKVGLQLGDNYAIDFPYLGVDVTREENMEALKESIIETLSSVAEEITRADIMKALKKGEHVTIEALNQLIEAGMVTYRRGARGKHLYSLVDDRPEPDEVPDENDGYEEVTEVTTNTDTEDVPY